MNTTLSMLSQKSIASEIDDLLVEMRKNAEYDYSEAIARIFLLKSICDTRDHIEAFSKEVTSYAMKKAKQQVEGRPFLFISDLSDIMNRMIEPLNDMAVDKMEEMYSEMSLIECNTYSSLCGE